MMFDREPIGAEDAILWHMEQIDFHNAQALANAPDADHELRNAHMARFAELEEMFLETVRVIIAGRARDQEAQPQIQFGPLEPTKPVDAILWHLERIWMYEQNGEIMDNARVHRLAVHRTRLGELEAISPAASVNARLQWHKKVSDAAAGNTSIVALVESVLGIEVLKRRQRRDARAGICYLIEAGHFAAPKIVFLDDYETLR